MSQAATFEILGLRRGYGGGWRLDLPAIEVRQGEFLAILGPTGAGKSTLLRLLHLLDEPEAGRLVFEGIPIPFPAPLEIRRSIGMVFQRPLMLTGSVRDNIAYGLKVRRQREGSRVEEMLHRFDLEHLAPRDARTVSGGEMQRLALARALASRPRVLLLDEPAASLDPGHTAVVEGIIRDAHREDGTTIVLATHNLGQARRLAQRVGLLASGRLVEIGETEDLFTQPRQPLTAAYLRGELLTEEPADS
ncbi:MAG TPA: ATP-binding cassette domain-containing protein [Anaerolineales bacterium]|nr:ATP-binding cassette domain-containing protein [Anaerolineales bacterium]